MAVQRLVDGFEKVEGKGQRSLSICRCDLEQNAKRQIALWEEREGFWCRPLNWRESLRLAGKISSSSNVVELTPESLVQRSVLSR